MYVDGPDLYRARGACRVSAAPRCRRAGRREAARRGVALPRRILSEVNDANIKCIIIEATSGAGAAASHAHTYSHY